MAAQWGMELLIVVFPDPLGLPVLADVSMKNKPFLGEAQEPSRGSQDTGSWHKWNQIRDDSSGLWDPLGYPTTKMLKNIRTL